MSKAPKVIAILIAFNAAKTLKNFYKELPRYELDEIILFDDASSDNTFEVAKKLGILSFRNKTNRGYGGNLKKALAMALLRGAEIIVDIHPDGEYRTNSISAAIRLITDRQKTATFKSQMNAERLHTSPALGIGNGFLPPDVNLKDKTPAFKLVKFIDGDAQMVLGNRFYDLGYMLNESGMYIWKIIPIVFLNFIAKTILRTKVHDLHQGFRVYSKKLLEKVNFEENSNGYLFSFELVAQAVFGNIKILEIPVETNYRGKKRGASMIASVIYTLGVFKVLLFFIFAKIGYKAKIFKDEN